MRDELRVLRLEDGVARVGGRELAGPGAPRWIDCSPTLENLAFLGARFGFHPLALEDAAHEGQRVKFEAYPDNLFAVVHRLAPTPEDDDVQSLELHAFLGKDLLVTIHRAPFGEIDGLVDRVRREPELLRRGADFVLYLVLDAITDSHFAVIDALTEEIEDIAEEAVSAAPGEDLAERIVAARHRLAVLRRRLSPQREVLAALARPGQELVRDATALYFRDVVDHAVRLTEAVDMGRELLASAMDAHLTAMNNRLSKVTTRLTLVATIFLPLNFLVGFFGMNLEILPPRVAIPLVLGIVAATPSALWLFFRKKRWM